MRKVSESKQFLFKTPVHPAFEFSFASRFGLLEQGVRKIFQTIFGLWFLGLLLTAHADTFQLADGTSLTGDIIKSTDTGLMLRQADNAYTNVLWTKFSQESLKQLGNNPKIQPFVEPFIEIPLSERPHKPEVTVHEVTRLELPPQQSFFGALFSSPIGIFALLLIYAANIYSGYEIAVVRARPKGLVMGVAAVLPIIGPVIFLSMPMQVEVAVAEPETQIDPATFAVPGQPAPVQDEVHVTPGSWQAPAAAQAAGQVFQRGQFTFNRRFIETKFAGFFGQTRSAADANNLLIVKTAHGQFSIERITRIAASEMQVLVASGETHQEITVPFADIHEIQVKPRPA